MSLTALISRPCTIIRRTSSASVDELGNATGTETLVSTVVEIQQRRRDEPEGQGELSDADWIGFFPADTDLDTSDSVLVEGEVYEVVGAPWAARNPRTQTESHVEASLKRTGGAGDVS